MKLLQQVEGDVRPDRFDGAPQHAEVVVERYHVSPVAELLECADHVGLGLVPFSHCGGQLFVVVGRHAAAVCQDQHPQGLG